MSNPAPRGSVGGLSARPQVVSSYAITIEYEGQRQRLVIVAGDIAQAATVALERLRECATEGRVVSIEFLGEALVGGPAS